MRFMAKGNIKPATRGIVNAIVVLLGIVALFMLTSSNTTITKYLLPGTTLAFSLITIFEVVGKSWKKTLSGAGRLKPAELFYFATLIVAGGAAYLAVMSLLTGQSYLLFNATATRWTYVLNILFAIVHIFI